MGALRLIFQFAVSLSIFNIIAWGMSTPTGKKLTLTDKTDEAGNHMTCHASKPDYKENFKWEHSMEDCSKPRGSNLANFIPLKEDKYNKIVNSENEDEFLSTITQVGSTGKEDGPKHCVCCVAEINGAICFNLTMQHEHHHHEHHHHEHHHH